MKQKILVMGLDGATFDLIKPLIKMGKLPNMAKLMESGTHGVLKSIIHPITPAAWVSFYTGKNPGKHGIFDFRERKKGSYDTQIINGSFCKEKSLWSILSDNKKKVAIINVPMTFPPEPVNGFLISGMDSPSNDVTFTYPPDLYMKLKNEIGEYIIDTRFNENTEKDQYIASIDKMIRDRGKTVKYFLRKYDLDFLMVVFVATDRVSHAFWKYMDPNHPDHDQKEKDKYGNVIFECYQKIDNEIGEILNVVDDNTQIIIMSDHGFGPLYKDIYINKWLMDKGLLKLKEEADGELRVSSVDWGNRFSSVDWENTKAYSFGFFGNIFINLKGREKRGVVEPGKEYEDVREYIINGLYDLCDVEDGKKIVDKVYKSEELYFGKNSDKAPDLLIKARNYSYMARDSYEFKFDDIVSKPIISHSGNHTTEGVYIISGKDINSNLTLNASILDVAPTILHMMEIPIPSDMDGRVLKEIFKDNSKFNEREIKYRTHYEECSEKEKIKAAIKKCINEEHKDNLDRINIRDMESTGKRIVPGQGKPLERLVPGKPELNDTYVEHISRYIFAKNYIKDKTVLDTGCGCGYGSYYLAEEGAKKVVGVDISEEAIEYSKEHYKDEKLEFKVMDCTNLSFPDNSFDVVVSFELIEHIPEYKRHLSEVQRVLRKEGVFIISTPNKKIYSDCAEIPQNEFHVKEFYFNEFQELLMDYFDYVEIYNQRYYDEFLIKRQLQELHVNIRNLTQKLQMIGCLSPEESIQFSEEIKPINLTLNDIRIDKENIENPLFFIAVCGKQNLEKYKMIMRCMPKKKENSIKDIYENSKQLKNELKNYNSIVKLVENKINEKDKVIKNLENSKALRFARKIDEIKRRVM